VTVSVRDERQNFGAYFLEPPDHREPSDREWVTAFTLSLENPISIHDAVYVAFCCPWSLTDGYADAILTKRLKYAETSRRVIMLGDLAL